MGKRIFKPATPAELAVRASLEQQELDPKVREFDPRAMEFVKQFSDQRISTGKVQEWVYRNRGIPRRTFFWYLAEGLIPSPASSEGRNTFFSIDQFLSIVKLLKVIGELKKSRLTRFSYLKDILNFYQHSDDIVTFLENLTERYPLYKSDSSSGNDKLEVYQLRTEYIWDRTIKALLEKKSNLPRIVEFEHEYEKAGK